MSIRKALIAVSYDPELDIDELPPTEESRDIGAGLVEAYRLGLVVTNEKLHCFELTRAAWDMLMCPVRRVA